MKPGIVDAHCHLADLPDPDRAIHDATAAGSGPILAVSMGPGDGARVLELKRRHPGIVLAGLGLHPSRISGISDEEAAEELRLVAERAADADFIGEIGLDYKDAPDGLQQARQREILERLLEIAEGAGLPVNLHTRRADSELLGIAREFTLRTGLKANLHWFTHSKKLAWRCAEAGLFISAGPSITIDPKQMDVARAVAEDLLLVETDSPVPYAGEEARPSWAPRVASALAEARGLSAEDLAVRLRSNLACYLGGA